MYVHLAQILHIWSKKVMIGPLMLVFCVWTWKSRYIYTLEVQTYVCYIDRLEVLMKVQCQIWPKQRLSLSS